MKDVIPSPQPWNSRNPNFEEERRYFNLIEIHKLTQAWLHEISPSEESKMSHRIQRMIPPELTQTLWLLEKVKLDQLPPELSKMVDAQSVSEFLDELEETILIVQMTTLENAMENSNDTVNLLNLLEKVSWKQGRKIAEARWPHFSADPELDPKNYFYALMDSPLWTQKRENDLPFLLERATLSSCSFYWVQSPLAKPSLKISKRIMELCQLYHEMIRGYFYGLSRSLKVEIIPTLFNDQKVYHITLQK